MYHELELQENKYLCIIKEIVAYIFQNQKES